MPVVPRKPTRTRQTVAKRSSEIVDAILGMAQAALEEALTPNRTVVEFDPETGELMRDEEGQFILKRIGADYATARWLIDRAYPRDGALVPIQFKAKIDTMDDIIDIAAQAMRHVLDRQMSIREAEDLLQLLLKYAQLRAFERLDELKTIIKEMEQASTNQMLDMPDKMVPQWGRLSEKTKTVNKTPAE